jgi:hypothetical protein
VITYGYWCFAELESLRGVIVQLSIEARLLSYVRPNGKLAIEN